MCIRDRVRTIKVEGNPDENTYFRVAETGAQTVTDGWIDACLLYTSDAADERSSVDLGGRRIIKKKNQQEHNGIVRVTSNTLRTTATMRCTTTRQDNEKDIQVWNR